ncbi:MAG: hypothetical protein AMXMBFR19_08020 [Chthonomonadaceae bacterium]|uniref:Glycoside hydrolase family 42 N-terminal domain-containing protein n=1 Tax=Candidatus Nitrosymbiomonas proteolyticus TaxID=2608984 RepID=A0A809RI11_9BACT|nr:conserved hypothetical protein [Candidatus Nitrosymbiomonas proteolyticus]
MRRKKQSDDITEAPADSSAEPASPVEASSESQSKPAPKASTRGRRRKAADEDPDAKQLAFDVEGDPPANEAAPETSDPPAAPRGSRRRKKPDVSAEATPEPNMAKDAPEPVEPQRKPRRTRSKVKDEPATVDPLEEFSVGFPTFSFRAIEPRPPRSQSPEARGSVPRKSRDRRRREHQDLEITAAAAVQPRTRQTRTSAKDRTPEATAPEPQTVVEEPKKPEPKPLIPIPADAPQIVVRDGIPSLVREGKVIPPLAFFGSPTTEERSAIVFEEIHMAGAAGVHLHFLLTELEVDRSAVSESVAIASYLISKAAEADPEAQVILRLVFVSPTGWESSYPDAVYSDQSGRLAEPSVADDEYWDEARKCLIDFIKQIRKSAVSQHLIGIHLERGEWFIADGVGYDTSRAATRKFRDWARTRYNGDEVSLRAAWFNGQASFANLEIPPFQTPKAEDVSFVRLSRKERPWVDYHLFLSDATASRVADLAYAVKEASAGYFLAGVSYGYTFEWAHPASGHLSLGKILRTPEIDFVAGPPSYRNREPGGAAPFPCPVDSFPLNGKLYISEEDYKTAISSYAESDDFNPVIKTPQALECVHWRGIGAALAHASGVCWMDLWGNGWLKTSTIWNRGTQALSKFIQRMSAPLGGPDVAVFIDERALAYLVDKESFAQLVQNVRESVLRSGLSAGFYLLSDLAHREQFPESKVYIFLNAWDMRSEHRAAIKARLQKSGKVLFWLYAAGLFDAGRESLERAREVTGIALKPQPFHSRTGTTILNRRHPLCEAFPDRGVVGGGTMVPSYFAIPEEATVLGEYSQTGLPSFVVKEFRDPSSPENNWTSVFLGEPSVSSGLIRSLGQYAGAHVWNFHNDVVHVRPPFLTIHCTGEGQRALALPANFSAYDLLKGDWSTIESATLRFNALDGSTHLFLVGLREELQALLAVSPDDALRMEDIPTRPENTTRFDLDTLDVSIVQLGEWIEGGVPEEISDEWFLKPLATEPFEEAPFEEPATEEPGKVGRRRRSRRRPMDSNGGRGKSNAPEGFDELGLGVMFRKRD